jgi:hypothetical protein
VFLKEADTSVATPPAAPSLPATTSITSGFSNVSIGGATPAGGATYSGGTWSVQGGGTEIWGTSDSCHFAYQAITGDCAIVAKVDSVQNTHLNAKAGVMMRTNLDQGAPRAWMTISGGAKLEQNIQGLTVYGGTNYSNKTLATSLPSYWVKLERIGNIVTGYVSPDGTNWAATDVGRINAPVPSTIYVGLVVCSFVNGTLNTSAFSNVQITGGNGGAPVLVPAAPAAILASPGDNLVPLRWQPSFGAASYTVKRATTGGGPYSTIASGITSGSYTDATVTNGTTYYYVVSATNSAGTSANSPEDAATPRSPLVNVAFDGTPTDITGNATNAAYAFDRTPVTRWFHAGAIGWLQYDFGASSAQLIKRYTVSCAIDLPARDPKDWQFQGSNDGSAWTTLDTQSNQIFDERFQLKAYTVASPASYRYYRLNITANNGDASFLHLGDFGLYTDLGRTIPNGTYRVLNRKSNKALDLVNDGTADGTDAVQWAWDGGNSQKWTFTHLGNGQYQALGVASGKLLEVTNASGTNGAIIQLWPSNNHNCQKWTVTPAGNGTYKLVNVNSGKAADVSSGSTADGAGVIQWTYGGGANQQWILDTAP